MKLWSAQSISQFGTQVSALAIPLAAIIVLHASAFEVASLNTAQIGGPGLGGVIVGLATAPYAILVDAASFVWSAVFIGIRSLQVMPQPEELPAITVPFAAPTDA